MQRVRIGLTGLAFVFLVVLLAAVFTSRPADETPITPETIERQGGAAPAAAQQTGATTTEPLAELGVAPGNADSNAVATGGQPSAPQGQPR